MADNIRAGLEAKLKEADKNLTAAFAKLRLLEEEHSNTLEAYTAAKNDLKNYLKGKPKKLGG